MTTVKKICICSICSALCYVLPVAFHAVGVGSLLSPMHLPVLLCGLLCSWPYGLFCGVAGPLLSCILSGMPSPAVMVYMVPELCAYGLAAGLGMKWIRTGKTVRDLYLTLIPAMIFGRVVGGVAQAAVYLSSAQSYSVAMWASAYVVGTLPGVVVQLVVLPGLVWALTRARLVPARYPAEVAAA